MGEPAPAEEDFGGTDSVGEDAGVPGAVVPGLGLLSVTLIVRVLVTVRAVVLPLPKLEGDDLGVPDPAGDDLGVLEPAGEDLGELEPAGEDLGVLEPAGEELRHAGGELERGLVREESCGKGLGIIVPLHVGWVSARTGSSSRKWVRPTSGRA